MSRLQTIMLAVWSLLLVLVALSNWSTLFTNETVNFLFLEFNGPLPVWLLGGGLVMPILVRLLGGVERGRITKRAGHEIDRIKTAAFDNREQELEQMVERITTRVEDVLKARLPGGSPVSTLGDPDSDDAG